MKNHIALRARTLCKTLLSHGGKYFTHVTMNAAAIDGLEKQMNLTLLLGFVGHGIAF